MIIEELLDAITDSDMDDEAKAEISELVILAASAEVMP